VKKSGFAILVALCIFLPAATASAEGSGAGDARTNAYGFQGTHRPIRIFDRYWTDPQRLWNEIQSRESVGAIGSQDYARFWAWKESGQRRAHDVKQPNKATPTPGLEGTELKKTAQDP
jgi:hypothetical protein